MSQSPLILGMLGAFADDLEKILVDGAHTPGKSKEDRVSAMRTKEFCLLVTAALRTGDHLEMVSAMNGAGAAIAMMIAMTVLEDQREEMLRDFSADILKRARGFEKIIKGVTE